MQAQLSWMESLYKMLEIIVPDRDYKAVCGNSVVRRKRFCIFRMVELHTLNNKLQLTVPGMLADLLPHCVFNAISEKWVTLFFLLTGSSSKLNQLIVLKISLTPKASSDGWGCITIGTWNRQKLTFVRDAVSWSSHFPWALKFGVLTC